MITRRAFTAALSLTGLAALAGFSPLRLITDAIAQGAADVAKPQSPHASPRAGPEIGGQGRRDPHRDRG